MEIPNWMISSSSLDLSEKYSSPQKFLDKTLNGFAELIENTIFSEKYANKKGFLQKLDPRIKIITLFALLITINVIYEIAPIFFVYLFILLIAYVSQIEISFFIKRVWLFIPVFAGVIALPSIFNIFTPGTPLLILSKYEDVIHFWIFEFTEISITKEGIIKMAIFTFRVATSVSIVVLLTLTTHWFELLKALKILGIPHMFILVLSMTYQYIFILTRIIQDMFLAKKSRSIPQRKHQHEIKENRIWIASRIGTVFRKSYMMIDEIQNSMLARGYQGEIKLIYEFKILPRDGFWVCIIFINILLIILLENGWLM